jgi:hypothetical protein
MTFRRVIRGLVIANAYASSSSIIEYNGAYIGALDIDKEWWRIMFGDHRGKTAALAMGYFSAKLQRKWTRTFHKLGSEYQNLKEQAMYVSYQSTSGYWMHPGRIKKTKAIEVLKSAKEFIRVTEDMVTDNEDDA